LKKTSFTAETKAASYPNLPYEHDSNSAGQIDVDWQAPAEILIQDELLAHWLLDVSSLTERLQSACNRFEVVVVKHQLASPRYDEFELLGCSQSSTYIREVILLGDGVPWVFARSVIPKEINDGELDGLGNEPLGKRIFNDPRFKRGEFQLCQLDWSLIHKRLMVKTKLNLSALDINTASKVYGRRSCFDFLGYKMSVAELFLPESPAYSNVR